MIGKLKNKLISFGAIIAFCFTSLIGITTADQPMDQKEFDQALQALPELAEDLASSAQIGVGGSPRMKCFVDTPALDIFTFDSCFSVGAARTTTAVFRIDNMPANFTIIWSDSRCNSSSATCFLPIRQFRPLTLNATVLDNDNFTFSRTSATAEYEGFQ